MTKPTFEASMTRLEEIVVALERGDKPLEEAISLFEEGTKLMKTCNSLLEKAEQKVAKITVGANGLPQEVPFQEAGDLV